MISYCRLIYQPLKKYISIIPYFLTTALSVIYGYKDTLCFITKLYTNGSVSLTQRLQHRSRTLLSKAALGKDIERMDNIDTAEPLKHVHTVFTVPWGGDANEVRPQATEKWSWSLFFKDWSKTKIKTAINLFLKEHQQIYRCIHLHHHCWPQSTYILQQRSF